jgi:hypothetical protein
MLTLNFGFEQSIALSIAQTWLLFLFFVICFVAWKAYKKQCGLCFQYVAANFNAIWYFFIMIVLTVLTVYHFDDINYKDLSFAAITASALIVLLFLPFFRRIVAFGVEAEIAALESRAKLEATEKIIGTGSNPDSATLEKEAMLQKFQSLKAEIKAD